MLHCQGCHLRRRLGLAGRVPALARLARPLPRVPGGREYLVRVPGVGAVAALDARLAALLDWMLRRFGPAEVPADFVPYTRRRSAGRGAEPLIDVAPARRRLARFDRAPALKSQRPAQTRAGRSSSRVIPVPRAREGVAEDRELPSPARSRAPRTARSTARVGRGAPAPATRVARRRGSTRSRRAPRSRRSVGPTRNRGMRARERAERRRRSRRAWRAPPAPRRPRRARAARRLPRAATLHAAAGAGAKPAHGPRRRRRRATVVT